jgi:hypothetical protein
VVAAAQRLFAGPQVRVQRISGEPTRASILLTKGEPAASGVGHSPFFEALAAIPLDEAPLQVLVEGVHYQRAEGAERCSLRRAVALPERPQPTHPEP